MYVDFAIKKEPRRRVAAIVRVGPWKEDNLRSEFRELTRWAAKHRLKTGKWIFYERDRHRWEACLEVRGTAATEGRIRLKTLPATHVAFIRFDPDQLSPSVAYHGLSDWTRWRKKDKAIRGVTAVREVYSGDPWTDKKAWANCEVQFVVRK